jgi:voltage-gated potassium channel
MRTALARLHQWLIHILDDNAPPTRATQIFNAGLASLIGINVAAVVLESVESVRAQHDALFWWIEQLATAVFAVEYVARVWVSTEVSGAQNHHPLWGRLHYMRSFFALVDLVAVLPAILGLLGASDIRVLRLIRLLRMLKLTRHSTVFGLLWDVVREEARSIVAVLFIVVLTLTMSASLMYMVEGEAQPKAFSSIPEAMWWSVETLTTVGYGDIVPVTPIGKLLGGIVSVVGIGTLALFSGLITVSFMDQLRMRRRQYRRMLLARQARGILTPAEKAEIERIGDRMGLPEELEHEVEAEVETASGMAVCPHCGHALVPQREPANGA